MAEPGAPPHSAGCGAGQAAAAVFVSGVAAALCFVAAAQRSARRRAALAAPPRGEPRAAPAAGPPAAPEPAAGRGGEKCSGAGPLGDPDAAPLRAPAADAPGTRATRVNCSDGSPALLELPPTRRGPGRAPRHRPETFMARAKYAVADRAYLRSGAAARAAAAGAAWGGWPRGGWPPHASAARCMASGCAYRGRWRPVRQGSARMEGRGAAAPEPEAEWEPAAPACAPPRPPPAALTGCLRGRVALFVGDSNTRAHMFALQELHTGTRVGRRQQVDQCKQRCGMWLPGPALLVYVYANPNMLWCPQGDCLRRFPYSYSYGELQAWWDTLVELQLDPDVVVSGVGWAEPAYGPKKGYGPTHEQYARDIAPDAARLACILRHLSASGAAVYQRSFTPMFSWPGARQAMFSEGGVRVINGFLEVQDRVMAAALRGSDVVLLNESALARQAAGQPGDEPFAVWLDHVHFPPVSQLSARLWLSHYCSARRAAPRAAAR
eukprot:TRINITY_DN28366_c0_g1_i1.p1 TRINITY_DN28366_c0_g1~~TRINITY_DN28366_c0_g1_i1.p1  ORF type:complete len:493 (+),score=103.16 TRINITY_DN28366_c0_g1_i1:88-1566(+)